MKSTVFTSLFIVLLVVSLPAFTTIDHRPIAVQEQASELSGVRVAMWHGQSSTPLVNDDITSGSALAPKAMMEWMGCDVNFISSLNILQGLDDYDILFVCGWPIVAGGIGLLDQLTSDHIANINSFVANGGIYIGICGGSALGCTHIDKGPTSYPGCFNGTTEMDLFNGTGVAPIYDYESPCIVTINVNRSSLGPNLSEMNSSYSILYNFGSYFKIDDWSGIHILARYSINNKPAIIALQKYKGCVLLMGPHPEWEENSTRDAGGTWDNIYEDPESEWPLVKTLVEWCVDNAETTTTTETTSVTSTTTSTSTPTSATTSTSATTADTTDSNYTNTESLNGMNLLLVGAGAIGICIVVALVIIIRKRT